MWDSSKPSSSGAWGEVNNMLLSHIQSLIIAVLNTHANLAVDESRLVKIRYVGRYKIAQ